MVLGEDAAAAVRLRDRLAVVVALGLFHVVARGLEVVDVVVVVVVVVAVAAAAGCCGSCCGGGGGEVDGGTGSGIRGGGDVEGGE